MNILVMPQVPEFEQVSKLHPTFKSGPPEYLREEVGNMGRGSPEGKNVLNKELLHNHKNDLQWEGVKKKPCA